MTTIHAVGLSPLPPGSSEPIEERLLAGEIPGLEIIHRAVPASQVMRFPPIPPANGRVLLFLSGTGHVVCGEWRGDMREMALLVPRQSQTLSAHADTVLHALDFVMVFSESDEREFRRASRRYPLLRTYSACERYTEAIKSSTTINRTLLPANIFPRLCLGSVEATGPDVVAAHRHPMLEQLFVGLAGNDARVRADDTEIDFGAYVLLHIPLGSEHSVHVGPGRKLHYIWVDWFRNADDVAWIARQHRPLPAATPPSRERVE